MFSRFLISIFAFSMLSFTSVKPEPDNQRGPLIPWINVCGIVAADAALASGYEPGSFEYQVVYMVFYNDCMATNE